MMTKDKGYLKGKIVFYVYLPKLESTKCFKTSIVERILVSESLLTSKYDKVINDMNALYDFIEIDSSNGNDNNLYVSQIKGLLCYDSI